MWSSLLYFKIKARKVQKQVHYYYYNDRILQEKQHIELLRGTAGTRKQDCWWPRYYVNRRRRGRINTSGDIAISSKVKYSADERWTRKEPKTSEVYNAKVTEVFAMKLKLFPAVMEFVSTIMYIRHR